MLCPFPKGAAGENPSDTGLMQYCFAMLQAAFESLARLILKETTLSAQITSKFLGTSTA
jgi:hypothetical protein